MAENQDPQERLIPRAIQEHNEMTTELWWWDQKSKKIRKKKLNRTDPIHQPQAYTDWVDMQTTWERYRVIDEHGSPIDTVLWNVISREGAQIRVLMTMEAFRVQRPLFEITRPNYMRLRDPQESNPETSP